MMSWWEKGLETVTSIGYWKFMKIFWTKSRFFENSKKKFIITSKARGKAPFLQKFLISFVTKIRKIDPIQCYWGILTLSLVLFVNAAMLNLRADKFTAFNFQRRASIEQRLKKKLLAFLLAEKISIRRKGE